MEIKKYHDRKLKLFSLNGNRPLAEKIAAAVGTELGKCQVKKFSDGEIAINLEESVRGDHVYVIQSTNAPVNDHYLELLIMIDALKRASAKTVNVVLPYYGYARQDRIAKSHEPITAKLIANLIEEAGATRVLTLDLHTVQVQGFFDIPEDNLFTVPLFADYYWNKGLYGDNVVIVSPKNSGVKRARSLAETLNSTIAIVNQPGETEDGKGYVIGDVAGRTCLMIDDIMNTGATFANAAEILEKSGAGDIYACSSHGLLSPPAKKILNETQIKDICITDSVETPAEQHPDNLTIISCAKLMGEAVKRIHENQSVSVLFRKKYEE